jgi:ubiquinone/menaquinone biosynthesis C-methylase UbiE
VAVLSHTGKSGGAGRLSRALATHFGHVIGIDVSVSMIAAARTAMIVRSAVM